MEKKKLEEWLKNQKNINIELMRCEQLESNENQRKIINDIQTIIIENPHEKFLSEVDISKDEL